MDCSADALKEKKYLREKALERRGNLSHEFRRNSSGELIRHVEGLKLGDSRMVAGFWPIRGEIDPRQLMEVIRESNHRIALPVVQHPEIVFREYSLDAPLVDAGFGTMGPGADHPEVSPDVLLVPLAAFDRFGGRIGYGKGYYDRAIAKLGKGNVKCIGVAFSVQEVERVPMEAHDMRLPFILTENGLIECQKG